MVFVPSSNPSRMGYLSSGPWPGTLLQLGPASPSSPLSPAPAQVLLRQLLHNPQLLRGPVGAIGFCPGLRWVGGGAGLCWGRSWEKALVQSPTSPAAPGALSSRRTRQSRLSVCSSRIVCSAHTESAQRGWAAEAWWLWQLSPAPLPTPLRAHLPFPHT